MDDTDTDPHRQPEQEPAAANEEAQRAADGLKSQIAALRDQVRKARADLLREAQRKAERRSFED
jgi:hypothetical protein